MKRLLLLLGVAGLAVFPATAHGPGMDVDFYFSVDVPADVPLPAGSTTVLPWVLARHTKAGPPDYTLALAPAPAFALPLPARVDACHLLNTTNGDWLFSVSEPLDDPSGLVQVFLPGDVIRYDSTAVSYTKFFCGTLFGLPDGIDVDAAFLLDQAGIDGPLVFQRDDGDLVLSFDAPVDIAGVTYRPSDLIRLVKTAPGCAGWTPGGKFFDSLVAGIPASSNVTGADLRGGTGTGGARNLLLTFDVPTDDPGAVTTYLPGDIAAYDLGAGAFAGLPFHRDPVWPVATAGYTGRLNSLCLLAAPGRVPCTGGSTAVRASKGPGLGQVTLEWSASCSIGTEDYGIHEGVFPVSLDPGLFVYNHDDIDCSDAGADLKETVTSAAGSTYYLVVAHNANDEGSYGVKSVPPLAAPSERPVSSPAPNCTANATGMRELSCP